MEAEEIKLQQVYTLHGKPTFIYKQVKREGDIMMSLEYNIKNADKLDTAKPQHVEVFKLKHYAARMSPDKKTFIAAKELPPPDSQWGQSSGSWFPNKVGYVEAEKLFAELVEKDSVKNKNRVDNEV